MAYTFANLKRDVRRDIWVAGEPRNQFVAHNKSFVDALVDLQMWVECLQIDNTQIVPHCSTFFTCGLTVFDAPRGAINRLSVIEKVNEDGEADAAGTDDWCKEIPYEQVDFCNMQRYLRQTNRSHCCVSVPLFFALPQALCGKGPVPVPTDEGLPDGLAVLQQGFHYPQTSTDSERRSQCGKWAMERGRIYVAPWIQSTETIVVRWDGIKRDWLDGDLVDNDPLLKRAVEMFVRKEHSAKFDLDFTASKEWERLYNVALSDLIHNCREETMVRGCEPSNARGSRVIELFYNDAQTYTASCPPNEEGDDATVTVPADTVGSSISKADANARALEQARTQAEAQLDCDEPPVTFWNTPQPYTAECVQEEDAPVPDGNPVTVTIPANTYSSTTSQAAADALALAAAQEQAEALLECIYWNREQEYTAECPEGEIGDPVTATVAEHTYSSTESQALADQAAHNAAKMAAEEQLEADEGCATVFYNTLQGHTKTAQCFSSGCGPNKTLIVSVTVQPGAMSSIVSVNDANQLATAYAVQLANAFWNSFCDSSECGNHFVNVAEDGTLTFG